MPTLHPVTVKKTDRDVREKRFFSPTAKKIAGTAAILGAAASSLLLAMIPVQYDLLDLREVPGILMIVFLGLPIRLFNLITGGRFKSTGEGFLVFPSGTELFGALAIDIVAVYLVICVAVRMRENLKGDGAP